MSTVVICGGPQAPLSDFETRLRTMGVAAPLPPPSGQIRSMPDWLARLFASRLPVPVAAAGTAAPAPRRLVSRILRRPARPSVPQLARVWELAANEIYLANADVACWGWSDVRNSHVLDFLDALDGDTRYVMLVQSPAQALACVQSSSDTPIDVDAVLGMWEHATLPMLRFCKQHRERVFLSDVERWQDAPASAAAELARWLGLPPPDAVEPLAAPDPVLQWLMQQGVAGNAATREQWGAVRDLLPSSSQRALDIATVGVAWIEGRREVRESVAARDALSLRADALVVECTALTEATAAAQRAAEASQHAASTCAEENTLLREQLHLAQQALERHLHNLGERERKIAELARKLAMAAESDAALTRTARETAAERDAERKRADTAARAKADVDARLAAATEAKAAAERNGQELAADGESLLQALHHAQEQLEIARRRLKHAEDEGARLVKEVATAAQAESVAAGKAAKLATDRDAQKQRADALVAQSADLAAKLAVATAGGEAAQRTARERGEDNELLLQELHRAQEALEGGLRSLADRDAEARRFAARLARYRKSFPGHTEWDEATACDEGEGAVRVAFCGLAIAGVPVDALAVVARFNGDAATLSVDAGQPAAEWAGTADDAALVLDPDALPRSPAFQRMAALSTTAWAICCALPDAVRQALAEHGQLDQGRAVALTTLHAQLAAPQPLWRADGVSLHDEVIGGDREHLCLHLANASFGGRTWPRFAFRVASAQLRATTFGAHPAYEFPLQSPGLQPFESWHPNATDDGAATFAVRFDTRAGTIDVDAWKALNRDDQSQLVALLLQLPRWLGDVADAGAEISREWSDWTSLNNRALAILYALVSGNGGAVQVPQRIDRPAAPPPAPKTARRAVRGSVAPKRPRKLNGKQVDPA